MKTMLLGELVAEVVDLLPIVVDLVVLDLAKITCNVKPFGERFTDIPVDIIHSGRPCMVQPSFKPIRVSTKLACMGTDKQVFQISETLVTLCSWHNVVRWGMETCFHADHTSY